ncbi:MAG: glycosyltransferase [Alistipes sp.]|nr:glycosyltransferase [Alistipes sp.]
MPPKISIIVPIYKAEKYLTRCIDSILTQTFTDFELLLIDDGSPDRSGEICDEYAQKDNRIKVFHKKNEGVSATRQFGLERANGEYVIHTDPDDWIEKVMLEDLYNKAYKENADMVFCDYYWDKAEKSKIIKQHIKSLDNKSVLAGLFGSIHGSVWNKLIKRECCLQEEVSFPAGINLYEDLIFNILLLIKVPNLKIAYLEKAYYHYIQYENTNSLTRNYKESTLQTDCYIRDYILELTKDCECHALSKVYLNTMITKRAFFSGFFKSSDFRRHFNIYKNDIIKSKHTKNIIKIAIYLSCIGLYKPIYWIMDKLRN